MARRTQLDSGLCFLSLGRKLAHFRRVIKAVLNMVETALKLFC